MISRTPAVGRPKALTAVAFILSILLTSCASYHAEPIDLHTSAERLTARTLNNQRLTAYLVALGLPPSATWGFRRLTYVAVFERPRLTIADAKYRVALGKLRIAQQISNPKIGISTGYNATDLLPTPWSVGPIFSFLIQNFFTKNALIGAARQNVLAAREAIDSVAWDERGLVYDALLGLWAARRVTILYRQEATLDRSIARAIQERYRGGAASATALTTAKLNAERAAFQQHQAELAASVAMVKLANVVGLPSTALGNVPISFTIFRQLRVPDDITADEQTALVDRPIVRKALAEYNAAQYNLKATANDLVNGLKASPGYSVSQQTYNYSLAIHAHLPVFNQHRGQIEVARAERRLAAARLKSIQESVFGQIEHAVTYWRESRSAVAASRRTVQSAQRELAASRQAYRAGTIGDVRLLGVRLQVLKARIQMLSAERENYRAVGELMTALHRKFLEVGNGNR